MLFPSGVAVEDREAVNRMLSRGSPDAATVRRVLGYVDRWASPSPFTVGLSADDIEFVIVEGFELALDPADRAVSAHIKDAHAWETHIAALLRRFLTRGDVFLDVGANVGYHTLLAAAVVGEQGRVIAVEPNPQNAMLIACTIARNSLPMVRLLPIALATEIGYASFGSAIGSNGGFAEADSANVVDPNLTIVPTMALDDLALDRVDVIKIDVEGAEPMVIEGGRRTIERHRPVLVFEFSCAMTERVGGVAPREHLLAVERLGYELHIVERRRGDLLPIGSVDQLLTSWGNVYRIEDLVAVPTRSRNTLAVR
jgi:FkbM family methyltransferase